MKTISSALLALLLITPALVFSQNESSSANQNDRQTIQQQRLSSITGCLTGKPDEYQLVDESGTRHLILNPDLDLSSYIGHDVEVSGSNDTSRDASASSDEGTAYGMHFFKVARVSRELDSCK